MVISNSSVLIDNYNFYEYHGCLKAKSRLELVGDLHWRKEAICVRNEINVEDIIKD